jgi:GNAT superfamily N-acetyltransferase
MRVDVTTYYLEMTDPQMLRPTHRAQQDFTVQRVQLPCPEFNRFLYTAVGSEWYWLDRLSWTYRQWLDWLDRPAVQTWVAYVSGTPAGYFELETQDGDNVELVYFGLLPQFTGKGLGGALLTTAIARAWAMPAARVWVHTCTLDHPSALANYCARGFRLYHQETHIQDIPEQPPGPWPGACRSVV